MNATDRLRHHREMVKLVVIAVAFAACGRGAPPCSDITNHLDKYVAGIAGPYSRGMLVEMCSDDRWSGELRACIAGATDEKAIKACAARFPTEMTRHSKDKIAKLTVLRYAEDAFVQWSMAHSERACPDKLDDLNEYTTSRDVTDPWGNRYKMLCGQNLPPGAKQFAVLSFGPDGREGTADDIKSWE